MQTHKYYLDRLIVIVGEWTFKTLNVNTLVEIKGICKSTIAPPKATLLLKKHEHKLQEGDTTHTGTELFPD